MWILKNLCLISCLTNDCGLLLNYPLVFLEALHLFKIEINYNKMPRLFFQLETGKTIEDKIILEITNGHGLHAFKIRLFLNILNTQTV